jgi:hypothetical protein
MPPDAAQRMIAERSHRQSVGWASTCSRAKAVMRWLSAILVTVGVAGVMTYAGSRLFGEVLVEGNGSDGFTCTWVVPDWGPALALGAGFGIAAGLLFWLVLARRHVIVARQHWLAALAVVGGSAIAIALLFPPPEWAPQYCPPEESAAMSELAPW